MIVYKHWAPPKKLTFNWVFSKLLDFWKQIFKMNVVGPIATSYFRNQRQKWIKTQVFSREQFFHWEIIQQPKSSLQLERFLNK